MIEEIFTLARGPERTVEKVVQDDNVDYIHMLFNKDEGLPPHYSNSNVYMTVLQGTLTIGLNDQDDHFYPAGTLLKNPLPNKNERQEYPRRFAGIAGDQSPRTEKLSP